jgi:hypothetical protein
MSDHRTLLLVVPVGKTTFVRAHEKVFASRKLAFNNDVRVYYIQFSFIMGPSSS